MLCDQVADVFKCKGFFTTDELPRYGIDEYATQIIYQRLEINKGDGNLGILCGYDKELSIEIFNFLQEHFQGLLFTTK